jgi:sugar phosphate isomerase/epimerase
MTTLALHQITAPGTDVMTLVSIAQRTGCRHVCIFVNATLPGDDSAALPFPVVDSRIKRRLINNLRQSDISVANVEFFPIAAQSNVESYRAALELAAELGARCAVTHLYDPHVTRTCDKLGKLCEIAGGCGLRVAIEFAGLTAGCSSLGEAVSYVHRVGRENLGIAIDALHLVRTGGTAADVAALEPRHIAYAQICDGHGVHCSRDYLPEALNRLVPGEGDFPLASFVQSLSPSLTLDVEVPVSQLPNGLSALEHAQRSVEGTRQVLASIGR